MTRATLNLIVACAILLVPACQRKRQVPVPPSPVPQTSEPTPAEPPAQPEPEPDLTETEPRPTIEPETVQVPVSPPPEISPPAPAPPAPPKAEPTPPQPAPRLAPLVSPAERERFLREIDQHLAAARKNVLALEQRQLTAEGQASLNRVRTFISQAEAARATDLPTARGLAERASVLAEELSRSNR